MKRLLFIPIAFVIAVAASGQALRTFNSTNDLVDASHNPMSQNTNSWIINTNDMSYQLWTWWQGDTSAVGTYNLQSLRPGVVGRYKLVENLHWNHIPDVNGDTFVIINNTNQGGLIGALTVPYIPYASDTNKLRDSHLYWTADGTGTSTNFYVSGFSNSVDYARLDIRHGGTNNSIHFDSQSTGIAGTPRPFKWDFGSSNYLTLSINGTENPSLTFSEPSTVVTTTLSQNFGSGVLYNASSLSVGAANDGFTIGSGTIVAGNANGGLIQHQGWGSGIDSTDFGIYHTGTNGVAVLNSHATAGSPGGVRDFIFATNGVEIARLTTNGNLTVSGTITATGGMTNAANWNPVGTTDSSLAGTATAVIVAATNNLSAPVTPTVTPTGTPGAATWTYKISALMPDGRITPLSAAGSTGTGNATLTAGNYNALAWTAYPTALSYFVYRTVVGGTPNTTGLIATVDVNSYDDQGAAAATNVNIPTTAQGLTLSGALRLGEYPDEQEARLGVEGDADVHGSIRSTGVDNFRTGSGTELQYIGGVGDVMAFNRDTGLNIPLALNYGGDGTNGPVLVNTRTPDGHNALQVNGNTRISGGITVGGFTTVAPGVAIYTDGEILVDSSGNSFIAQRAVTAHYWDNLGVGLPANFRVSNASGVDTLGWTVLANGKMGIATNAPSEALEVAGSVKATGYKSWDGANTFTGITATNSWVDASAVTWTMVIQNGLVTSMTHVP